MSEDIVLACSAESGDTLRVTSLGYEDELLVEASEGDYGRASICLSREDAMRLAGYIMNAMGGADGC